MLDKIMLLILSNVLGYLSARNTIRTSRGEYNDY